MEIWEDIKGYEGLYKISNYGEVASVFKKGLIKRKISVEPNARNQQLYNTIVLRKNGKGKKHMIARLVAQNFLGIDDIENYNITYKDGNTTNCYYKNLEVMSKYSIKDRYKRLHDIEYEGKCFKNVKELIKFYGLTASTFYNRLMLGWDLDATIKTPPDKVLSRTTFYKYRNKFYTMKELSEISGLKRSTLISRIQRQKWSVEQAVETPKLVEVWNGEKGRKKNEKRNKIKMLSKRF